MNGHESETFITELTLAFPAFREVAEKHSCDYERTKAAWAVAWNDIKLSECREALRTLLLDGGIRYEEYREPGPFIRRMVLAARNRGKSSEQDRAESSLRRTARTNVQGLMSKALEAAKQATAEGKSESECLAIIDQMLPKSNDFDGPTYKCKTCCDRGLVVVWRSDFIQFVRDGKLSVEKLVPRKHTYPIACHCDAGYRINQPANPKMKLPHYSSGHFILFRDRAIELEREFVQEWLEEQRRPVAWVG